MELIYTESYSTLFGLEKTLQICNRTKKIKNSLQIIYELIKYIDHTKDKYANVSLVLNALTDIDTVNLHAMVHEMMRNCIQLSEFKIIPTYPSQWLVRYLKFGIICSNRVYVGNNLISNISNEEYEDLLTVPFSTSKIYVYNKSVALCMFESYRIKLQKIIHESNAVTEMYMDLTNSNNYSYVPFIGMPFACFIVPHSSSYRAFIGECPITCELTQLSVLVGKTYNGLRSYCKYNSERKKYNVIHPLMSVVRFDFEKYSVNKIDPTFKCPYDHIINLVYGITPSFISQIVSICGQYDILLNILDLWWILTSRSRNEILSISLSTVLLERSFNSNYLNSIKLPDVELCCTIREALTKLITTYKLESIINFPYYYVIIHKILNLPLTDTKLSDACIIWDAYDRICMNILREFECSIYSKNNTIIYLENCIACAEAIKNLVRQYELTTIDQNTIILIGLCKYKLYKCWGWFVERVDDDLIRVFKLLSGNDSIGDYFNQSNYYNLDFKKLAVNLDASLFIESINNDFGMVPSNIDSIIDELYPNTPPITLIIKNYSDLNEITDDESDYTYSTSSSSIMSPYWSSPTDNLNREENGDELNDGFAIPYISDEDSSNSLHDINNVIINDDLNTVD